MNEKKAIATIILLVAVAAWLLGAVVLEFDAKKRYDITKITDQLVIIDVPLAKVGATRALVPADIVELRKSQSVTYDAEYPEWASRALVVMIVPAEHMEEMAKRIPTHPEIHRLQLADLPAASMDFEEAQEKVEEMETKIVNALTPAAVPVKK